MTNPNWRDDAQCYGMELDSFDVDLIPADERTLAARKICGGCPVIAECRTDAINNWHLTVGIIVGGVAVPTADHGRARALALLQNSPHPAKFTLKPKAPKAKRPPKPNPTRRPKNCTQCAAPLAPARTTLDQIPEGHRVHRGHGLCDACYLRARRNGGTPTKATGSRGRSMKYTHCSTCSRPLRPSNRPARNYPGTVQHAGHGICSSCNIARRRKAERQDAA